MKTLSNNERKGVNEQDVGQHLPDNAMSQGGTKQGGNEQWRGGHLQLKHKYSFPLHQKVRAVWGSANQWKVTHAHATPYLQRLSTNTQNKTSCKPYARWKGKKKMEIRACKCLHFSSCATIYIYIYTPLPTTQLHHTPSPPPLTYQNTRGLH